MLQIYTLGILAAGILNTFIGLIIYFKNRKALPNILFGLVTFSFAIWCYSWVALLSIKEEDGGLAIFFARLLNFGAVFIPFFYFHWIISILGLIKKEKISIIAGYIIALFFGLLSWSNSYVENIHPILFFPNWPTAGSLYKWYLIFGYFPFVLYATYRLLKHIIISQDENRKNQLKYVILVTVLGFGAGALNFPLMYKINPFGSSGNFGMFVGLALFIPFPILLSYSVVKYHFMDIKVILTEVLAGFAAIVLFIDLLLTSPFSWYLVVLKSLILIIFIYLGISLVRNVLKEVKQREQMEVMAKEVQKAYEVEKAAKEEVEKLTEAKTQFIMATQHHLRTPLTSIIGYLDLLFGGTYGKVPPKIKETLLKFQVSTKRLIRVVNALLDISQFQMGKRVVALEPNIDFESLIKEVMEELSFEVKMRGLYLKYEKIGQVPAIKADSEKLKVALFNIIDNAIKYTKQGGIIVNLKQAGKLVQLSVKDTGIGVDPKQANKLFKEAFARGDEAKKVYGFGSGIGVYVTGHIIRAHNGRIWAESEGKGKGSTFFIELPIG